MPLGGAAGPSPKLCRVQLGRGWRRRRAGPPPRELQPGEMLPPKLYRSGKWGFWG